MKKILTLLLIAAAAVLVLTACGGEDEEAAQSVNVVTLTATDIAYDKQTINAKVGEKIRLTLINEGELEHDFSIMEMALDGEAMAMSSDDHEHAEGEEHADDEEHMDDEEMPMDEHAQHAEMMAVHMVVAPGESATVEFTPTEAGTYSFNCTVEGHVEAGMAGELVVSE